MRDPALLKTLVENNYTLYDFILYFCSADSDSLELGYFVTLNRSFPFRVCQLI